MSLVNELKTRSSLQTIVCVTGQHRQMLDQVLECFYVNPDYDLSIMKDKQTLFDITSSVLEKLRKVLDEVGPDLVLVHGDTTTSFAAALACFYQRIPVGHVEAGLRTYRNDSPFPEEFTQLSHRMTSAGFRGQGHGINLSWKLNFILPTEASEQIWQPVGRNSGTERSTMFVCSKTKRSISIK